MNINKLNVSNWVLIWSMKEVIIVEKKHNQRTLAIYFLQCSMSFYHESPKSISLGKSLFIILCSKHMRQMNRGHLRLKVQYHITEILSIQYRLNVKALPVV